MAVNPKVIEIVKSKKLEPDFDPSMKTLSRIMQTMTEKGAEGKTQLSLDTNLNYARLAKHLSGWRKKDSPNQQSKITKLMLP